MGHRFLDLHGINVKSNYDYFFRIICQPIICKLRHDPFDFFFFSSRLMVFLCMTLSVYCILFPLMIVLEL